MSLFCLWPFGRSVVRKGGVRPASMVLNVIWFVLAGWWLALGHLLAGMAQCSRSSESRSGWRTSS